MDIRYRELLAENKRLKEAKSILIETSYVGHDISRQDIEKATGWRVTSHIKHDTGFRASLNKGKDTTEVNLHNGYLYHNEQGTQVSHVHQSGRDWPTIRSKDHFLKAYTSKKNWTQR